MITLHHNGQLHATPAVTVAAFLTLQQYPQQGIAVALNGAVVPHSQWVLTSLKDGDTIEIIGALAGG